MLIIVPAEMTTSWSRGFEILSRQVGQLKDAIQQLEHKCDVVNSKTSELQRNPCVKMRDHDILSSL